MNNETELTRIKKYYWNGNASTHQAAVFKFAVWGSIMGGIVSLSAGVMMMKAADLPTREFIALGTLTIVACWLMVWLVTFLACNFAYYALIESQIKQDTPPLPIVKREIFYVSEGGAKIVHRDK